MNTMVTIDRHDPLTIITLNDPDRANPLSPKMVEGLHDALKAAADEDSVRAVILRGKGKHFSAGADLAALHAVAEGGDPEENLRDSKRLASLFATLLDYPKLSLAAVNGAAVAGGCGLATACDFVIAGESARFCYTEVKIGFIPALVSTFLTRRIAGHHVRSLLLDPEMLDAPEAARLGLVDSVVADDEVLDAARKRALSIVRKGSPAALKATKKLLNQTVGLSWREALDLAAEANAQQRVHPECRRGVRSFLDTKKTPDWLTEV